MITTTIETGIDWDDVKAEMEASDDWEDDWDGDGQRRSVFLGTVFALFPSHKFYMPWACSNLDTCPRCHGRGGWPNRKVKRRTRKKWAAQKEKLTRRFQQRHLRYPMFDLTAAGRRYRRLQKFLGVSTCSMCEGCGSAEAYQDELYQEQLQEEADEHGYSIQNGEGDPVDIFVVEYRDKPEDLEDDDA
jgi:hypothetical protein